MTKILSILFLAFLGLPAFAQTWNQAASLTNLLAGTPVVGGLYVVHGYRTAGDWGAARLAKHVPGSTLTTNRGNEFAFGTGRLHFYDATNTVQDVRWWDVRLDGTTDNRTNFQALANYMPTVGGGVILQSAGTNALSDIVTFTTGTILRGVDVNTSKVRDLGAMTAAKPLLYWAGSVGTPVSLAITNPPGTNIVYLSSAISGLTNGSRIRIADTNSWSYSGYRSYYTSGEDAIVASVDGTTVYTLNAINGIYTNGLAKVWPITDVYGGLENITVQTSSNPVPVRVVYGRDFRIKHARIQGSQYENVALDGCYNASIYDAGGDTFRAHSGNDYWCVIGGSQNVDLTLVSAVSPGHPISVGSARALPSGTAFISIVNRFINVSHSFANSYASRFASIDVHGNAEYVQVGPGNSIQRGVSIGGNRHRVFGNINIGNPEAQPAINFNEQTGSDFQVTENKFSIVIGNTNVVWGVASQFSPAGLNGSATNWWAGDGNVFSRDTLQVSRNTFSIFNGPLSSGSDLIFLGESTGMNTNASRSASFGPWIVSDNTVDDKSTPASDSSSIAIDVQPIFLVRPASLTVERNHLGPYTIFVRSTALNNRISDNIISGAVGNSGYGGIFVDDATYRLDTQSHTVTRNFVTGSPNLNSINVTDVAGFLDISDNVVDGWNVLRDGIRIDSANARFLSMFGNRFRNTVTTTNLEAFSVSVPNAIARLANNRLQTTNVTFGSITTTNDYSQWRDDSTYVALTGRGLSVPFMPELSVRGTNWVDTLTATNTVKGSNLIAFSASIGTGTLLSTPGKSPIHIYGNTNELARIILENASTGTGAGAGLQGTAAGVIGRLMALNTNNTTGARKARFAMDATTGSGLNLDLPYPTSQDIVFSYGGGTPFAVINTNAFAIRAPATGSSVTYLAGFTSDPSGTHRTLNSFTTASVLSAIGAQPLDADLTVIAAATGASNLVTSGDYTGHYHTADRNRTNHTGTQAISTVINLQTELDNRQATNANLTTLATLNGSALTNLNGTEIRSGTVAAARIDSLMATDAEVAAGYQPLDSDLTALAALTGTGLLARTGAGGISSRTVTGDSEITVTNGDGVSGNPTLAIDSSIARDAEVAAGYQPLDTDLTRLATVGWSTGDFAYRDSTGMTNFTSTSAGRALLNAVDAAAQRTSLGLGDLALLNGIGVKWPDTTQSVGITNLYFANTADNILDWVLSDFQPTMNISAYVKNPFTVNGAGISGYSGGMRWNLNSTTPAAPSGFRNLGIAVSGTNVVVTNSAPYFLSSTLVGTNNSSSEFTFMTNASGIPAGYIRDGGSLTITSETALKNDTGSSRVTTYKLYIGQTPTVFTIGDGGPAAYNAVRIEYFEAKLFRSGTNFFARVNNITGNVTGTQQTGGAPVSTLYAAPNAPTYAFSVSDPDSTAIPISFTATMAIANTNYYATNVFIHIEPN